MIMAAKAANPGTGPVGQGVDDLPHLVGALVAADGGMTGLPGGDGGLDQGPPLVGQVALVGLAVAHEKHSSTTGLPDQPRYACATRSSDDKRGTASHTAL